MHRRWTITGLLFSVFWPSAAGAQPCYNQCAAGTAFKMMAQVIEVFKAHASVPPVGGYLTIERAGGEYDDGQKIVRTIQPDFPAFAMQKTYVSFLRRNHVKGVFEIRLGPTGAYRVQSRKGAIEALGRVPLAMEQNGRKDADFLAELRTLGRIR